MNELVKYGLFAVGGAIVTIIILKAIKKKVDSKPSQTANNFKTLAKTNEFKELLKTSQFKSLLKTKEFKKLALDFGAENLVTYLEI